MDHKNAIAFAKMPSNIALIKYMGKQAGNHPLNASLSLTLPHLYSTVYLHENSEDNLITDVTIKEGGKEKFLSHLGMLKKTFNLSQNFTIYSYNNFPSGCGLASSASSYAALTMATYQAARQLKHIDFSDEKLANLSRLGSGSSCRSFFGPFALWTSDTVKATGHHWPNLHHETLMFDNSHKTISSSQAHQLVQSSPLLQARSNNVTKRLEKLTHALDNQDWPNAYDYVKTEFIEMHELFHTSSPSFSYLPAQWQSVVSIADHLVADGFPLLLTMDAGPNMHFLMPLSHKQDFSALKAQFTMGQWSSFR